MTGGAVKFALNPLQWITVDGRWRYAEPGFRSDYPGVLAQVRAAGFDAVMLEVLATQTLRDYARMIEETGLALAPGYCAVGLPEDHGVTLRRGSAEWVRWFDGVRRKAEESHYFGLDTIFLAPEMNFADTSIRTREAVAVGAAFDEGRLDRLIEVLGEAAGVLRAEGVRAGLHNHVGTWVETEHEIDRVLGALDPALLGASFDVGHLVWAGIDPIAMLTRYADRLVDVHVKDLDLAVAEASRATRTGYDEASERGLFREPGTGGIDLDAVLAALPDGFPGWIIIEIDRTVMAPLDSARACQAWVERVTSRGALRPPRR
jgi:sugar phosphate isomerase/epimerase